jgi:ribosomal protein S27AE
MLHHWIYELLIIATATSLDLWHTGKCYITGFMNERHTGKCYIPEFTTHWKMLHHWIHDTLVNDTSLDFMALANATSPERWHTGKCYIPGVYGTCQCYVPRIPTYLLMLHHSNYDIQYYLLMLHHWIHDTLEKILHYWIHDTLVNATSLDLWHTGKCYITGFMPHWYMLHHRIHDILVNATSLDSRHTRKCYIPGFTTIGKCYIPGSMTYR